MPLDDDAVLARYDELIDAWARHDLAAIQWMRASNVELVIEGNHQLAALDAFFGVVDAERT
jgi:hypothetical protein